MLEIVRRIGVLFLSFKNKHFSSVIRMNIALIFLLRAVGIVANFALVRLSMDFLGNNSLYGLWLTILSVVSWINYFDLGLGNGLRNKLTESLAQNDPLTGKYYVSTAYVVMGCIIGFFSLLFVVVFRFIPWGGIFPGSTLLPEELSYLMFIIVVFTVLRFFLSLVNSVAYAYHDSFIPALIGSISTIAFLCSLLLFKQIRYGDIFSLAWFSSITTFGVLFGFSIYLFSKRYKAVRPSFKFYKPSFVNNLFSLGIKFFIIQIAALVLFNTDNLIIMHVLGAEEVVPYQVTWKFFSIFQIFTSILLTPIWSAVTFAYAKRDIKRVRYLYRKMRVIFYFFGFLTATFTLLADKIIALWMGSQVSVPHSLVLLMSIYTLASIWNSITSSILNGMGILNAMLTLSLIATVINVPLSIIFASYFRLGSQGVLLGTIIALSFGIPINLIILNANIKGVQKKCPFYK